MVLFFLELYFDINCSFSRLDISYPLAVLSALVKSDYVLNNPMKIS